MSHVSEYQEMDRHAGRCATAALDSIGDPLSLEMLCRTLHRRMPASADELRSLALVCVRWKIRTEMDGQGTAWDEYQKEARR